MNESEKLSRVLNYYGYFENRANYSIVCPFHDDINPSCSISIAEGRFYCFGCAVGGNAMDFVFNMERGDDLQKCKKYYRILRSKKNRDLKISIKNISGRHNKINSEMYLKAYDYYYGLPKTNWFEDDSEIKQYMLQRGFTSDSLNSVKAKINISGDYPIIFPMLDNGKFKGWVCRTNNKDVEKRRKYLYNEGFRRSVTLVGNYSENVIPIICEGFMDRLSFIRMGCNSAIAILGWKITDEQILKLKQKNITTVISALDNDECGERGTEYLKKYFKVIRFPFPQGVKDTGEMTNKQIRKALRKLKYKYY